ncbi:hypothetical protein CU097_009709 [Rhizopus azygosporus]|uniref:Uncharacterized protein n=1 Tax=Rhizopus azygosporus TaxID=86630 RepID=A0A367JD30_RHIAZ|nr:hypothetical protein CU097_009709 [Rhizopus azygosporus]
MILSKGVPNKGLSMQWWTGFLMNSSFIQAYPEQVDLWEEVFNVIENHRDVATIRRVEDGEEVDAWDYGPYVLNLM